MSVLSVLFQVKVLYVKNLTVEVTEEMLKEEFEKHGAVERVKKIKDYGFVHFEERDGAISAMDALNGEVRYDVLNKFTIALLSKLNELNELIQCILIAIPGFPLFEFLSAPLLSPIGKTEASYKTDKYCSHFDKKMCKIFSADHEI